MHRHGGNGEIRSSAGVEDVALRNSMQRHFERPLHSQAGPVGSPRAGFPMRRMKPMPDNPFFEISTRRTTSGFSLGFIVKIEFGPRSSKQSLHPLILSTKLNKKIYAFPRKQVKSATLQPSKARSSYNAVQPKVDA